MSGAAIPPTLPSSAAASSAADPKKRKEEIANVGREFEAILVRQMLASSKVAGASGGYADMAVDALAAAVTSGGGLGLGRAIEDALGAARAHSPAPEPPKGSP